MQKNIDDATATATVDENAPKKKRVYKKRTPKQPEPKTNLVEMSPTPTLPPSPPPPPPQEPTYLKEHNSHSRDANITFEEVCHKYTVNGEHDYTSCTTFIHSLFPHFDASAIIKKMRNGKNWTPENKYYEMTDDEIKKMWNDNGKEASASGTKMHYDIECYFNKQEIINDSIEYQYFQNFVNEIVKPRNYEAYRTEWLVYYEEVKISGSIDMVFKKINGDPTQPQKYAIYDWKRSKEIVFDNYYEKANQTTPPKIRIMPNSNFWHYSLQLNIYRKILQEKYGLIVDELCLVCLHPNNKNGTYILVEVQLLDDAVEQLFEWRKNNLGGTATPHEHADEPAANIKQKLPPSPPPPTKKQAVCNVIMDTDDFNNK